MIRHRAFQLLSLALLASSAAACTESEAAPMLVSPDVNKPAPAFTVTDTKGTTHTLESHRGTWVVLEWFNHECPYTAKHYKSDNMQALQREYTGKGVVWFSVISSAPGKQGYHDSAADADRAMLGKSAAPSFIVRDTAGALGRMYGARTTPHLYAIDPDGVLRYAGAIDDKRSSRVKDIETAHNYLKAALDSGLAGRPIAVATTQPYGCEVKY